MSHPDTDHTVISPDASRAARTFLGLSQAKVADQSELSVHKLKWFEAGYRKPDQEFLQTLRDFYEGQGYDFRDEDAPLAQAKARGDVFPAGVVGETATFPNETAGSAPVEPGKLLRPQKANLQFMRISPQLENDQIDRVFDCIEENEVAVSEQCKLPLAKSFLSESPSAKGQAQAIALLRRLAENGLLYAQLMGRQLVACDEDSTVKTRAPRQTVEGAIVGNWKTIGELMQTAMGDVQLAVIDGNKDAMTRRKARSEPTEVLQALVG